MPRQPHYATLYHATLAYAAADAPMMMMPSLRDYAADAADDTLPAAMRMRFAS